MRLCITTEEHYFRSPDGKVWTIVGNGCVHFRRYLGAFNEVVVIGRVRDVNAAEPGWNRVDGDGVLVGAVPDYTGPVEYWRIRQDVMRAIRAAVGDGDAIVLRVGSQIAHCLESGLRAGRPFGVEVLGDPEQIFSPGVVSHPLRPVLRWWFARQLRDQCRRACAVSYVTASALQGKYPAREGAYVDSFVNLELGEEAFVERARTFAAAPEPLRIVSVGAMAQPYKGFEVLIEAVSRCAVRCEVRIAGDGRYRGEFEETAARLGVADRVRFLGALPAGAAVRAELDRADLFVLASRTEGLPKVVVEAMARAVPCLGSAVGGIPELLDRESLFAAGDAVRLAELIDGVARDPDRLSRMSAANLERARNYSDQEMDKKRQAFLAYLQRATKAWLDSNG